MSQRYRTQSRTNPYPSLPCVRLVTKVSLETLYFCECWRRRNTMRGLASIQLYVLNISVLDHIHWDYVSITPQSQRYRIGGTLHSIVGQILLLTSTDCWMLRPRTTNKTQWVAHGQEYTRTREKPMLNTTCSRCICGTRAIHFLPTSDLACSAGSMTSLNIHARTIYTDRSCLNRYRQGTMIMFSHLCVIFNLL